MRQLVADVGDIGDAGRLAAQRTGHKDTKQALRLYRLKGFSWKPRFKIDRTGVFGCHRGNGLRPHFQARWCEFPCAFVRLKD